MLPVLGCVDQFVQAWLFLPKDGKLERPLLETMGARGVDRQLDAKTATWDDSLSRWIFHDGVERVFGPQGVVETPFKDRISDLDAGPLELIPRATSPDELTMREALAYARRVGRFGGSSRDYEVAAMAKLDYPFTNLIICALGPLEAARISLAASVLGACAPA